jgi:alpha,alpha-trehalase
LSKRHFLTAVLCLFPLIGAAATRAQQSADPRTGGPTQTALQPPSIEFGDLYRAVEMQSVFPDQKTFADAIPTRPPREVMADYDRQKTRPSFNLTAFVHQHFMLPTRKSVDYKVKPDEGVQSYISGMWDVLERKPDEVEGYSSLLPLSFPYIVPGGRFSEIYYWDTFFTMLGLEQDTRHDLALDMLRNMASLIDRYGHVPNGNRTYYLSRSEPPFFPCMVELMARREGDAIYRAYLPEMQKEYDYWMEGAETLPNGQAHRHVVRLTDGSLLNRYWDDRAAPRDESYRQDVETARSSGRPPDEVYRDLRAGGETDWDFSSRWLADNKDLATIRTTAILPVDLNSLMAHMESVLAKAYHLQGDPTRAGDFEQRAREREHAVRQLMWDQQQGLFTDFLWKEQHQTHIVSAATVYPLYFRIATPDQAKAVASAIRRELLEAGGLATTLDASGEQWDKPNGWAPLQFLAVEGLNAYGEGDLAAEIARRWINKDIEAYEASGALLEKYNVETMNSERGGGGGGGEYPLQVGFGWTNGVLAKLMFMYPAQTAEMLRQHPAAAGH